MRLANLKPDCLYKPSRMKNTFPLQHSLAFLSVILLLSSVGLHAQKGLSPKEIEQATNRYETIMNPEISLEEYLNIRARTAREKQMATTKAICSPRIDPTGCENGDFESGNIDGSVWQFQYGSLSFSTDEIDYSTLSCGQLSNSSILYANSRHTVVPRGTESNLPLSTVPDNPSVNKFALRIGNTAVNRGTEMVSKSFLVTTDNFIFDFDYAVVLQNPGGGHTAAELPTFKVKIKDLSTGRYLSGLVDLDGTGKDYVDTANDTGFFTTSPQGVLYSEWLCSSINLRGLIGKKVTIEFITEDCGKGAHYAYAYIDNICNGCGNAPYSLDFNAVNSKDFGFPATLCFDYELPKSGSLTIALGAFVNGNRIKNFSSPTLTSGDSYCFDLTKSDLGINAVTAVDFLATGNYTVRNSSGNTVYLPKQFAGVAEYKINCPTDNGFDLCCPPLNKNSIWDLFEMKPTGLASDPYRMDLNPSSVYLAQMQAYTDYLHALNPNVDGLYFTWRLMDMGADPDPRLGYWGDGQIGGDKFNHFDPGGTANYQNNFFSENLKPNHWYKIHVGMYLNDDIPLPGNSCSDDTWFVFNWKLQGPSLIGTVRDSEGIVVKTLKVKNVKARSIRKKK